MHQGKWLHKSKRSRVISNHIGIGIVLTDVALPSLIVKIENLMTEDWFSGIIYKVVRICNEEYCLQDITLRLMHRHTLMMLESKGSKYPNKFRTNILCLNIEYKYKLTE